MKVKRPFSNADWPNTPKPVQKYIVDLERQVDELTAKTGQHSKQVEKLEEQLNRNSQNSHKPPSSDPPYNKPEKEGKKSNRKRGAQKGHKGHSQPMLDPTEITAVLPKICTCGNAQFDGATMLPFYTHQQIELPEIKMDINHLVLHKCTCESCGKTVKATIPKEYSTGYGPRLSALITELSGIHGDSREAVQGFCTSVLEFPISIGAIQNVIDRSSKAIKPIYNRIAILARESRVNYIDETSWFQSGKLQWLWVMVSTTVALFMVHPNRTKKAFLELIDQWRGILVSDNYGVYVLWMQRQACLAHYIRKAKSLAERKDKEVKRFGKAILKELRLLCHWAKTPPDDKEWAEFYTRFIELLTDHEEVENDAGKLARSLIREMIALWEFLDEEGVEPTNNRAERALRFGVLWRKRSKGTQSEKGDRWVERILSLKHTCRMNNLSTFSILVDAIDSYFKEHDPDLTWLG